MIYLRVSTPEKLEAHLAAVRGRISTVGVAGEGNRFLDKLGMTARKRMQCWREAFLALGVSRFCPAGQMQFPPLSWHHDGRAVLGELVTWIDDETAV